MNVFLRFFAGFIKVVYWFVKPIYWLNSRGKKRSLPPITDPLLKISATDLAEKIRKREISSEEICSAYIKRIKEVNPILNAVVEERFESALEEARNVDNYLRTSPINCKQLGKIKPLLGVPLTVKESCSLAGLSLSVGTLGRNGVKASADGEAVQRLKASGAIPLLVSNTPEICLSWESRNFITGTTNNPYDSTCTSSGSSGGEGALLGAGASVIGIGSDIAGSIRMPAMFNGIFGHKPTSRLIPIKGHYPHCMDERYADYLVIGPMCRYAKDLKLMSKIMTADPDDKIRLDEDVVLSKLKVFYMEEAGKSLVFPSIQQEIKVAIRKSVNHLKYKCNSTIVENYKFTELKNSCEIAGTVLYGLKDIPNLLKGENQQNLFVEVLKSIVGYSKYTFHLLIFYTFQAIYNNYVSNEGYVNKNNYLKQLFTEKLGEDGVFLYPTFPTSAFKHNSILFWSYGISYLMIVNTLGLPSTHVPCGLDSNGLPIGFQVIAAPNQDRLCFAVAEELEKCFGGWTPP